MKTTACLTICLALLSLPAAAQENHPIHRQVAQAVQQHDFATAFKLLKSLAEQGDAAAQNNLAVLYQDGLGVGADDTAALYWYEKAAAQGLSEAQFTAALMHSDGIGTPQDYAKAVSWYLPAAKQGHAEAQYNLAIRYATGTGTAQDLQQAEYWFAQAAAQGHPLAAHMLQQLRQLGRQPSETTAP